MKRAVDGETDRWPNCWKTNRRLYRVTDSDEKTEINNGDDRQTRPDEVAWPDGPNKMQTKMRKEKE